MHACRLGSTLQSMHGPSWCHRGRPEASIAASHRSMSSAMSRMLLSTRSIRGSQGALCIVSAAQALLRSCQGGCLCLAGPLLPGGLLSFRVPPSLLQSPGVPLRCFLRRQPAIRQGHAYIAGRYMMAGDRSSTGVDAVTLPLRSHAQMLVQDQLCHELRARKQQDRGYQL